MNTIQKTILLVEDEDEIGSHMDLALTERGYHVIRARNANDAIKLAELDHLSLILTDLELPTFNSLMDQLRAHDKLKHMVVAIIDINHPQNVRPDVAIVNNFDELEALARAVPHDQA